MKLIQSEKQLAQLQQNMSTPRQFSNGPSEVVDGTMPMPQSSPSECVCVCASSTNLVPSLPCPAVPERDTCRMQIPKGNNPRKQGWKDAFMVMSFTMKKILIYEKEEDVGTEEPITVDFRCVCVVI